MNIQTIEGLQSALDSIHARLDALESRGFPSSSDDGEYSYDRSDAVVRYRNDVLVYLVMDDMPGRVADEVAAAIIQAHKTAMRRP